LRGPEKIVYALAQEYAMERRHWEKRKSGAAGFIIATFLIAPMDASIQSKVPAKQQFAAVLKLNQESHRAEALASCKQLLQQHPDFHPAYAMAAVLAEACGKCDEMIGFLGLQKNEGRNRAECWYGLGLVHKLRGDSVQALEAFRQSVQAHAPFIGAYVEWIEMAKKTHSLAGTNSQLPQSRDDPFALYGSAYSAFQGGEWDRSFALLEQCSSLAEKSGKKALKAHCLSDMGVIHARREQWSKARELYLKGLQLIQEMDDPLVYTRLRSRLAQAESYLGNPRKALAITRDLLRLLESLAERGAISKATGAISKLYSDLGELQKSRVFALRALELAQKNKDIEDQCILLMRLGNIHKRQMNHGKAFEYFQQALATDTGSLSSGMKLRLMINIGSLFADCGDRIRGISFFLRALQIAEGMKKKDAQANIWQNLGLSHFNEGNLEEAATAAKKALDLFRSIEDALGQQDTLLLLMSIDFAIGKPEEMLDLDRKLMGLYQKTGSRGNLPQRHRLLGEYQLRKNNLQEAWNHSLQAIELAKKQGNPQLIMELLQLQGAIREKQGRSDLAWEHYTKASLIFDDLLRRLRSEEFRSLFVSESNTPYRPLVKLLFQRHIKRNKAGFDRQAFDYCERAKARSFLDMLWQKRHDIRGHIDPNLINLRENLEIQIAGVNAQLQAATSSSKPNAKQIQASERRREVLQKNYQGLLLRIALDSPRYAGLLSFAQPLTSREVQRLLGADEALIEFFFGADECYVFIISRSRFSFLRLDVSPAALRTRIERLRRPLTQLREGTIDLSRLEWDLQLSHELYRDLFLPIAEELRKFELGKTAREPRLIIVPDDALHYLAFEALVCKYSANNRYRDTTFLLQRYAIGYAVSASSLDPRLHQPGILKPSTLLGLANPSPASWADPTGASPIFRIPGDSNKTTFLPLPETEQEVRDLAGILGSGRSKLLFGREASEKNFKLLAGDHSQIHLATHGLLNEKQPLLSGLLLAGEKGDGEDGFLQAHEIYNLELRARLVVLSACETGLGQLRGGEGLIGLSRAFLYAGARAVTVSLWSVEESSTALMTLFYRELQKNFDPVRALRSAKLALMKSEGRFSRSGGIDLAHPFFWAPFVVYSR